jgi:hypothetical protein
MKTIKRFINFYLKMTKALGFVKGTCASYSIVKAVKKLELSLNEVSGVYLALEKMIIKNK